MDKVSKEKRHEIMSHVKSKDTSIEIVIRSFLFNNGYRYRIHLNNLPGKPDIVLKKYNLVIFVNGCFWHGHKGCIRSKLPETNKIYWANKIQSNIIRDKQNIYKLKKSGYRVLVIWECKMKNINNVKSKILKLLE